MPYTLKIHGPLGNDYMRFAPSTLVEFNDKETREKVMEAMRTLGLSVEYVYPSLGVFQGTPEVINLLRTHYVNGGSNKIGLIKLVRAMSGAGLKETKDFCDNLVF